MMRAQTKLTMGMVISLVLAIVFIWTAYTFLFTESGCRSLATANEKIFSKASLTIPCPKLGSLVHGDLDARIESLGNVGGPFYGCANERLHFSAKNSTVPKTKDGRPSIFGVDVYCDWAFSDGDFEKDTCEVEHKWQVSGDTHAYVNLTLGILRNGERTGIEDYAKATVNTALFCTDKLINASNGAVITEMVFGNHWLNISMPVYVSFARIYVSNKTADAKNLRIIRYARNIEEHYWYDKSIYEHTGAITNLAILNLTGELNSHRQEHCVAAGHQDCNVTLRWDLGTGKISVDKIYVGTYMYSV